MGFFDEIDKFMKPAENYEKVTGTKLQSGIMPFMGVGSGLSIAQKMFGTKKVVDAAKVAPIAATGFGWGTAAVGAGAGLLGGFLLGGSKKQEASQTVTPTQTTHANQYTTTTSTYSPISNVYTTTTQNIDSSQHMTNSPYGQMSKKDTLTASASSAASLDMPYEQSVSPLQKVDPTQTTTPSLTQAQGTDLTTIAIIAAAGLVGYGYLTKGRGKK